MLSIEAVKACHDFCRNGVLLVRWLPGAAKCFSWGGSWCRFGHGIEYHALISLFETAILEILFMHIKQKFNGTTFLLIPATMVSLLCMVNEVFSDPNKQPFVQQKAEIYEMDDTYTLTTSREIDAPVDQVWAAWNDPEKIAQWWGPAGFHSTVKELDVRQGGRFEIVMHGPDGTDYPNLYIFDHVEEQKKLIYTSAGSKEFGLEPYQSVFDIEKVGNKTKVVLKARFVSAEDKRKHVEDFNAVEGSRQLLERLEEQSRK